VVAGPQGAWDFTVKAVTPVTVLSLDWRSFEAMNGQSGGLREHIQHARSRADGPQNRPTIAAYHFGWREEHGHPTGGNGGKATSGAVAVELVHNFSLLHDDVMDRDTTRRHRPTAWSVFGVNSAIRAGDSMSTLAWDVLAGGGHPAAQQGMRMLSTSVQQLLDGQAADMAFEERADVDLLECVRMAEAKTGALLGCACAIGALFGGASPERVGQLRGFGESLGLAFQFVDDLLGIWGDPEVTGKPVHSDLRNRKKSLPVVAALNSGTAAGRELDALYHSDQPLSPDDLRRAADLVDLAGGRAWSQARADDLLTRARQQSAAAMPAPRPNSRRWRCWPPAGTTEVTRRSSWPSG
jgi:geranylgeranyl diphosphate synthase type I